jgi:hypothetical protein
MAKKRRKKKPLPAQSTNLFDYFPFKGFADEVKEIQAITFNQLKENLKKLYSRK